MDHFCPVPSYLSATSSSGRAKVYPFDAKRMDDLSSKGVDQVPSSVSRVDWRWFSVASVAGVIALLFAGRIRRLPVSPDGWKACLTATAAASVLSSATPVMALEEVFPLAPSVSIATAGPGHHAALAFKLGVEPLATYYGMDTPPTSYGGYGGNANEPPKYSFQYPETWKLQSVNKVQKGTQGVDSKFINPADKNEQCFAITLARAGEDAVFAIRDVDSTFQGFAAADYDIAEAFETADEVVKDKRTVQGQDYFDYDIVSDNRYLATVTVMRGKVYAFFIRVPSAKFVQNEAMYRTMLASFITIPQTK